MNSRYSTEEYTCYGETKNLTDSFGWTYYITCEQHVDDLPTWIKQVVLGDWFQGGGGGGNVNPILWLIGSKDNQFLTRIGKWTIVVIDWLIEHEDLNLWLITCFNFWVILASDYLSYNITMSWYN